MKVIDLQKEPTFTLQLSTREVQVIEQALYHAETPDSDFGRDALALQDVMYEMLMDAGVEPLPGDTE